MHSHQAFVTRLSELLKRLVYRSLGNSISIVAHGFLRDTKNNFKHLTITVTGIEKMRLSRSQKLGHVFQALLR